MNINGLSYRQWQKRNTDSFKKLSKAQQRQARIKGYYNISWPQVQESWEILQKQMQPASLFDAKFKRGDLEGAITQSLLEAEKAQALAHKGKKSLKHKAKRIKELAKNTLNKYQLL